MVFGSALNSLHLNKFFFLIGLVIGVSTTLGKKSKEPNQTKKRSNTKTTPEV